MGRFECLDKRLVSVLVGACLVSLVGCAGETSRDGERPDTAKTPPPAASALLDKPAVAPDRTAPEALADKQPVAPEALAGKSGRAGVAHEEMAPGEVRAGEAKPAREPQDVNPVDEAYIFTAPGFKEVGWPRWASGEDVGRVKIVVRDLATGKPTRCRVNVVGADGNFYQPQANDLSPYSLTGDWPKNGLGNRAGKAPIRYFGRFFYSRGEVEVVVPAGEVRVEAWKGYEYRPATITTKVSAGASVPVELTLEPAARMDDEGYYAGDPHIHIRRESDADDRLILDLMEAEGIRYGSILAYNEPAGPYHGLMNKLDSPQYRGLGERSIASRGDYHILSGQEYRSRHFGHLNLFLRSDLVFPGQDFDVDEGPIYGDVAKATRDLGGHAFYAHGGYAQAIYADAVQGNIDGVELLQFGIYRGIELDDWYRLLNVGFRFPATAACDYPACRKLGDAMTYIHHEGKPSFPDWLGAAAEGRSFISTGPLLLLEVDGEKPGARISKSGRGPHRVTARVRLRSEVTPVTDLDLIVAGRVVKKLSVPEGKQKEGWYTFEESVELTKSTWIAARAYSASPSGSPDAESHTNPVYVYVDGKAPYDGPSLDVLITRIDGQMKIHQGRKFAQQDQVLAYFQRSRDILLAISAAGGVPAEGHPADIISRERPVLENAGSRTHSEAELEAFLKPVPPKPIEEVLKSFETVDGFRMELVAQEPLVVDPVSAAFDENGNLYVVELRDYPYLPKERDQPLGTVRLLRDTDGDGTFDEGHVFAEHLLWGAGVAPWKGGVFVAAPPDIWYLKDTDGDHRADVRRKVYTGFGTENPQGMLNNLQFGLDHKIYGSTSANGGTVQVVDRPDAEGIPVGGRDFRFDPMNDDFETITGTVQFGNSFDDWGNRFTCAESQPLEQAVLPQRYLARNPYLAVPRAIENIAPGPVPIYRISPVERWRHIRSSRRIAHGERPATSAGASQNVIDAAAGVTVYRGGAYPAKYYGNVFVGDAANNLIHRRVLAPQGVTFTSTRGEEKTEFVRSPDNWFRPVNFMNAPDGTLYALDLSREVLEAIHIPLDVLKYLDLTSGRKHGRIYRMAPPGFKTAPPPRLGAASTAELVAALESPHGWWRDTAHRLIYERQDESAVSPLRQLLTQSKMPQARLHALWSLQGLGALSDEDLSAGLSDTFFAVREHAIRLAEPRLDSASKIMEQVLALADDDNPRIRCQVAFTLGETNDPQAAAALGRIARRDAADRWIRTAVLSSVAGSADRLLCDLVGDWTLITSTGGAELCQQLALVVGAANQSAGVNRVLGALAAGTDDASLDGFRKRIVLGLGRGLKRSGADLTVDKHAAPECARLLENMTDSARAAAQNVDLAEADRRSSIELLGCTPLDGSHQTLEALLDTSEKPAVQIAAVRALSGYTSGHRQIAETLLTPWRQYAPDVRKEVIQALLAHDERTLPYLEAAREGRASVAQIDPARRPLLLAHRREEIRSLAEQLLGGDAPNPRKEVVAEYRAALALSANPANGVKVFERDCTACHRLGSQGAAIGPDLGSSPHRDPDALLTHVLDPNQYVPPNFVSYVVVDDQGRTFTGMIAAQTATSITLQRDKNETDTILRKNIDELVSSGKSLMPEGFEKKITPQEMADLIAFLRAAPSGEVGDDAPLDIGTLPGLVEPDR